MWTPTGILVATIFLSSHVVQVNTQIVEMLLCENAATMNIDIVYNGCFTDMTGLTLESNNVATPFVSFFNTNGAHFVISQQAAVYSGVTIAGSIVATGIIESTSPPAILFDSIGMDYDEGELFVPQSYFPTSLISHTYSTSILWSTNVNTANQLTASWVGATLGSSQELLIRAQQTCPTEAELGLCDLAPSASPSVSFIPTALLQPSSLPTEFCANEVVSCGISGSSKGKGMMGGGRGRNGRGGRRLPRRGSIMSSKSASEQGGIVICVRASSSKKGTMVRGRDSFKSSSTGMASKKKGRRAPPRALERTFLRNLRPRKMMMKSPKSQPARGGKSTKGKSSTDEEEETFFESICVDADDPLGSLSDKETFVECGYCPGDDR